MTPQKSQRHQSRTFNVLLWPTNIFSRDETLPFSLSAHVSCTHLRISSLRHHHHPLAYEVWVTAFPTVYIQEMRIHFLTECVRLIVMTCGGSLVNEAQKMFPLQEFNQYWIRTPWSVTLGVTMQMTFLRENINHKILSKCPPKHWW